MIGGHVIKTGDSPILSKEGAYMTLETLWQYLEEVAPEQEFRNEF